MAKPAKFDTSFNFGANAKPRKPRKAGRKPKTPGKRGKGGAYGS